MSMNVRRALPKIHFDQTLYRKANTCVFAINNKIQKQEHSIELTKIVD